MRSEIAGPIERVRERDVGGRRFGRELAIEWLGPLTVLGGIVWSFLQPSRIVFLDGRGKGFYDYVFQPPLIVISVGLVFTFLIAPGLVDDLRRARGRSEG